MPFDDAGLDELPADDALGIAPEQHAVGQNARAFAGALQRADDVQQVGVVALLGGWLAPGEALVSVLPGGRGRWTSLVGEGRIGDDVVEGSQLLAVLEQRVGEGVALIGFPPWGNRAGSCSCGRDRRW